MVEMNESPPTDTVNYALKLKATPVAVHVSLANYSLSKFHSTATSAQALSGWQHLI